jgi:phage tail sheath protein FI
LTIEKAIAQASMYFVMEPNDRETRQRLVSMINPFLADVQARRGIYDFLVVCDETNNTPERTDRNELWVDLKIKPVKAAEFIVLNFIAVRTGVSWTEV